MWLFLFHDQPSATCDLITWSRASRCPPLIPWSKPPPPPKRSHHGTTPRLNVLFSFNWMPLLSEDHLLCHTSPWLWCCVSRAAGGGGYGVKFPLFLSHAHTNRLSTTTTQLGLPQKTPCRFSSKHTLIVSALFLKQCWVFFWLKVNASVWDIQAGMKTSRACACINSAVMAIQWMTLLSEMNKHSYVST